MGKRTAISWTDHTFNLWWGCEHALAEPGAADDDISEECRNCYAETFDKRVGGEHWGPGKEPRWFGDAYWAKLRRWNAEAEQSGVRRRVFVSSMADWAQRHPDPAINAKMDAARARLWREIRACLWLDFLLLTKRAERLPELLPWMNLAACPPGPICRDCADKAINDGRCERDGMPCDPRAPWPNVWVGVTAGTRRSLWRVRELSKIRAVVLFVSGEPLLEHITSEDWDGVLRGSFDCPECGPGVKADEDACCATCGVDCEINWPIDWLIVGDESGPRRRPVDRYAIRIARDAAERNGVTFHLKQLHDGARKAHLPIFDGVQHAEFPEVRQ